MDKLDFCRRFVFLDGQLIGFEGRPYLPDIYAADRRNLVLRCSRQTEKSTFLVNSILYEACTFPGVRMLYVAPRLEQAQTFCKTRLVTTIRNSPLIRRCLLGSGRRTQLPVATMQFANGSQLFVRAAYQNADAARGLSVDRLYVDEFQDIASNHLPVLQETLSHARNGRTILVGTPKSLENCLEGVFSRSTGNEWTIPCVACGHGTILDDRALGPSGVVCENCREPIDPSAGRWVPRRPDAIWGEGYWICHPMVPWLHYDEILLRQIEYDPARFKNEVLGLPSSLGEHVVTRAELERCSQDRPMARSLRDVPAIGRNAMLAGIDWGGGGRSRTVLAIGFMQADFSLEICRMERFAASEEPDRLISEVARWCQHFRVQFIAADGAGNGHVLNRLLLDKLQLKTPLYAICYSQVGQEPIQDGMLWKWTLGRSQSIGSVFGRIKKQMIGFPNVQESGSFLDEFACEMAEYDDEQRSIRFIHPENAQDDALHATNYLLAIGVRCHHAKNQWG